MKQAIYYSSLGFAATGQKSLPIDLASVMPPKPFCSTRLCLVASHGPEPALRKSIF